MTPIGLVIRPEVDEALELGREMLAWVHRKKLRVLLEKETALLLAEKAENCSARELASLADPIVTLGGDGTLIGIGRHVGARSPVLVGVNFGQLGFLTEISPGELFETLERVLAGDAVCAERAMLLAEVTRGKEKIFSSQAVNDAVVQRDTAEKLLSLDVSVDDQDVMRVRGDGLIVSTPTGSTAYSLAAGGSIAYPTLEVLLLTPICPHSLTNRPLILPLESRLSLRIPAFDGSVQLIIDGQSSIQVRPGDKIELRQSPNKVKFVRSQSRSYFDILRKKLNWGRINRG